MAKGQNLFVGSHKCSNEISRLNWERTFGTICKKHPKYKALLKPQCECRTCWDFWNRLQRAQDPGRQVTSYCLITDHERLLQEGVHICPRCGSTTQTGVAVVSDTPSAE